MASHLKTWVSDGLMSLLGYSQPTLVQYVIIISKRASSPSDVFNNLKEMGVSSSNDTHTLAEEFFRKVEHKRLYRQEAAAMLARNQRTYKLLEADDDDDNNDERAGSVSASCRSKKTDKRAKRFKKKSENQEDEDDEGVRYLKQERRVKPKASHDEIDDFELTEQKWSKREEDIQRKRQLEETMPWKKMTLEL